MRIKVLSEYIDLIVGSEIVLTESKQNIVNLGFPEVIASILFKKFGPNAFLVSRWLKENSSYKFTDKDGTINYPKDWWVRANTDFFRSSRTISLVDLVELYEASKISAEAYLETKAKLGLSVVPNEDVDLLETQGFLKDEIEEQLVEKKELVFFRSTLISDILSMKITDLKPYKNLSFSAAKDKYDKLRIFDQKKLIKKYENGWKWIDVGAKCQLVGKAMKNCGSAGIMSWDDNATILTLFDPRNKPHVMVTYSPNEKRISGDEGQGSTQVKEQYHQYVLDLADHLGARFDYDKSKSKTLKLKAALKSITNNIELEFKTTLDEYFKVTLPDGSVYYTDTYKFVPAEEVNKLMSPPESKSKQEAIRFFFRTDNRDIGIYMLKFLAGER